MPFIKISKTYADGEPLLKQDLDNIVSAVEDLHNTTKYTTENFQSQSILPQHIINASLSEEKIFTNTLVASSKFVADSVTTDKLDDNAVIESKFADNTIENSKFDDSSITGDKFLANPGVRLPLAKLKQKKHITADNSNNVVITNNSAGITTICTTTLSDNFDSREILFILQPYNNSLSSIHLERTGGNGASMLGCTIVLRINSSTIRTFNISNDSVYEANRLQIPLSSLKHIHYMSSEGPPLQSGDVIDLLIYNSLDLSGDAQGTCTISPCKLHIIEL